MDDFSELECRQLVEHLRRHLQGEIRFDDTSRRLYSTDASIYQIEPLGVVIPRTVADLQTTVQIAAEMHLPIIARGGGTSLSGQAIGRGIVIDCSKYLNHILDVDPVGRVARVEPGVVLDQLNRAVARHGLQFGPEVATASRANLGGMIGNNSAGARSIVYGKTIDHVRSLHVLLADGSRAEFGPLSADQWRAGEEAGLVGQLLRRVREVVQEKAAEIERRFPRLLRRVSGYNLDVFCDAFRGEGRGARGEGRGTSPEAGVRSQGSEVSQNLIPLAPRPSPLVPRPSPGRPVGLHQLIVGSEGTLAVVTEAELALVPKPKAVGLLVPQFSSLAAAMDCLATCLEFQPSAVELLDQMLLELAASNLSLRGAMTPLTGRPQALFLVEFSGDDPAEVADRLDRLQRKLQGAAGLSAVVSVQDPAVRTPLWNLRGAAVPLLLGLPGDRKPVTFVEDPAVAAERLPEFVARFRALLHNHGTDGAFYGHASVGCLHIRPVLNLKDPMDVARMRLIAADVTDLVREFGGSLSGEHGDGLVRSEWNRQMFGAEVYEAFRQIKQAFDPHHLLNPGKVVDAVPMTENLRYGPGYQPLEPETLYDYSRQEGYLRAIELCNGSGVCRQLQGGTMCPSYRATRDEKDSTRGRANVLRLALAGPQPWQDLQSRGVHDVLDLCLMCKGCKSECPSNVDMAKLKAEFLHFFYQQRSRPLGHRLLARLPRLHQLGARFAPLVNWLQRRRVVRWLLERWAGIDRRRSLPPLYWNHLRRWFARHKPAAPAGQLGRVLLLDDCFTTFNEPAIGRAAVRVLEAAGYAVELAGLTCCGRTLISKGFLTQARELIGAQAAPLAKRLSEQTPLLGLEPSCLLTLADEWPELLPGPATRHIAAAAKLADSWLAHQAQNNRCLANFQPLPEKYLVHGHCHQKALVGMQGTAAALDLVPGLDVTVLDTGCCGMAGSFGFEKEHYDVSVAVANLELLPALADQPDAQVVATGTSCRQQIKDLARRRALHPVEVLARALRAR